MEKTINRIAEEIAGKHWCLSNFKRHPKIMHSVYASVNCMLVAEDLGLIMDKTVKLEWHKLSNTRTRCLRITQVRAVHCVGDTACLVLTASECPPARAKFDFLLC